ncbi:MAG: Uma2 family endonuclease [Chloroflexota bacterium]|nr:Uma2 family endonuclease [Chloroflexota bacterium]
MVMLPEMVADALDAETIVASNVSETEYMHTYAAHHCEWVDGKVIRVTPATLFHNSLLKFTDDFLSTYFELRPIGQVIRAPFVYKLPALKRNREPDLMVLLEGNTGELTETYYSGAADIVIEIISKESSTRDRGAKFDEYEQAGVREYWMFDSVRKNTAFYRLNADDLFELAALNAQGEYEPPLLPDLRLPVALLWDKFLPGPRAIVRLVEAMVETKAP